MASSLSIKVAYVPAQLALILYLQNPVPQVRLELTTSAFLTACTDYKYGALTDCATGAGINSLKDHMSIYITY